MLHAPFDEQWLIPDQRLIDAARPELWRVADERQVFVVEAPAAPSLPCSSPHCSRCSAPAASARCSAARAAREPNLAPGLLEHLASRLGDAPAPLDVLAWITAAARPDLTVPLTGGRRRVGAGRGAGPPAAVADAPRRRTPEAARRPPPLCPRSAALPAR